MKRTVFLLVLLVVTTQRVAAWSAEGHRAVALIAEQQLKMLHHFDKVTAILGAVSLADIATCPDLVRAFERDGSPLAPVCKSIFPTPPKGTSSWHFVNTPFTGVGTADEVNKACGSACVLSEIEHFRTVLANRNAPVID